MAKITLGALFIWAFALSAIPVFFFIRYAAERSNFDSIGTSYTIYGTVCVALFFAAAVVVVAHVWRSVRPPREGSDGAQTDA